MTIEDEPERSASLHLLPSDPFSPDRVAAREALARHGAEPIER